MRQAVYKKKVQRGGVHMSDDIHALRTKLAYLTAKLSENYIYYWDKYNQYDKLNKYNLDIALKDINHIASNVKFMAKTKLREVADFSRAARESILPEKEPYSNSGKPHFITATQINTRDFLTEFPKKRTQIMELLIDIEKYFNWTSTSQPHPALAFYPLKMREPMREPMLDDYYYDDDDDDPQDTTNPLFKHSLLSP
jgi:hypothetical protein